MTTAKQVHTPRQLVEVNQGLVHHLARRIAEKLPKSVEFEDLVGYGQVGLSEAARDYDATRGVQFSTYAYYRIRGAIYDGVSKMNWGKYVKKTNYQRMANEVLTLDSLDSQQNEPGIDASLSWFADQTRKLAVVYLCSVAGQGGELDPVDDRRPSADAVVTEQDTIRYVKELITQLPSQARLLIEDVYFRGKTIEEAGARQGISKSWASRVHARALEKLQWSLREQGVEHIET
jgi:RNA polymerase sigma factor for flagellar operon FliA